MVIPEQPDVESAMEVEESEETPQPFAPLRFGCEDHWCWNRKDRSHEVHLFGKRLRTAHFHPNWSNGTAGVRGTRILNHGRYYWEIRVSQRVFGTSMMFGIGTQKARLHVDAFMNLLGEDDQSWGLSHKGLLWHNGKWKQYTKPFRENEATTVGLLFDGLQGTLTYFKDGVQLGVAFTGLQDIRENLYPIICSTAAKTEMTLDVMRREFVNLQDRCRAVIRSNISDCNAIELLDIPNRLRSYLLDEFCSPIEGFNVVSSSNSNTATTIATTTATTKDPKTKNAINSCYYV